ncbi:MAG: CdaR family protein [Schwartzia sp. (in: firmicutes)]
MMDDVLNLFRHKFVVKLFALLAATVLWFFVMSDQNPVMDSTISVPVTFIGAPERAKVMPSASDIKVKLRGPRSAFASIRREEIKAVLDLSDKEAGTHHLAVQALLPPGLEVVSLKPEYVDVFIDPLVHKRQSIHLISTGSVGAGFTVSRMTPDATHVFLDGAETAVDSVAQVLGYVPFGGDRMADFDVRVPLSAVDADGRAVSEVTMEPEEISVHVQMARGLSKKVVEIKPIFEGTPAEGYAVTESRAEPARLEIAGDAAALDKISSLETAPITLTGATAPLRRTVSLVLPEGVTAPNRSVNVMVSIARR